MRVAAAGAGAGVCAAGMCAVGVCVVGVFAVGVVAAAASPSGGLARATGINPTYSMPGSSGSSPS